MKKSQILSRGRLSAGVAPIVLGIAMLAAPAYAQDTAAQADDATDGEEIVVTGSLISNPNLEQSSPVNVTTSDQIELKQSNVAEEVLRELPGVVPNIGSAVNNGNGGASFVDLRGLGANRNLVLLDGNRLPVASLTDENSASATDLNNIPLALIERVDALTGAAVTTYGADAVTGVVNFITRKDFAGLEVAASEQITQKGDGNFFRVDATMGANFDDGRGNAVLSIGYQQSDPVYQGARSFSVTQISSYSGGPAGSGTSFPSRFGGTRPLIAGTNTPNTTIDPAGSGNGGVRQINAAGQAVGTFATFNFNPFNVFQVPFERFNIFAQANYEVSDSVEVYTRGLFSKNTVNTIIAPSGSFGGTVPINLNNPFLPATLRNQFCAFNVAGAGAYIPRFTQAECDAAALATGPSDPRYRVTGVATVDRNGDGVVSAADNPGVTLNRRAIENGPRISDFQTTIFDYRVGARGAITDSIDWDLTGSYGESENRQTIRNYTLQSRFRQGAVVSGTAGAPVCQDPSNGCVPVNIFSGTGYSAAAADFLNENSTTLNSTSLAQVRGTISGETGFTSPWAGEGVGFAIGGEYRNYSARQESDLLAKAPGELGGAGGAAPDIDGGYDVYEAFGEIIAPIVEDKPFFHSLTLEAGIRYSSYNIERRTASQPKTTTYKIGGSWEPVESLKVRGAYSRAVRVPNIYELYFPNTVGLTNLAIDPCSGAAPTTNANLRAICLAQGAPIGTIGSINNPTAAQANITTFGSPNLDPEKATTYTVGVVWQPEFISNSSISVDYYNIKVKDAIGAARPGDLVNACFGTVTAASAASADCTAIRRNPLTGALDGDPAITGGLFGPITNQGELFTDGIDVIANWKGDIGFADLTLNFVGNWTNSQKFRSRPGGLNRECVGYYSVNCGFTGSIQPEFQFSQRTTLGFDDVDVSLLWRYIDAVQFEPQQLADDIFVANATGCGAPTGADPDGCVVEPGFRNIKAEHYFDLTGRWNATDNFTFTFTVQNLLNNKPKVLGNTIGSTSYNSGNVYPSTYDALGRRFAVSAKMKF